MIYDTTKTTLHSYIDDVKRLKSAPRYGNRLGSRALAPEKFVSRKC
jgi:hypothetical protein